MEKDFLGESFEYEELIFFIFIYFWDMLDRCYIFCQHEQKFDMVNRLIHFLQEYESYAIKLLKLNIYLPKQ